MDGEQSSLVAPAEGNMLFFLFLRVKYLRRDGVWKFFPRSKADGLVWGPAFCPFEEYGGLKAVVWGTLNDLVPPSPAQFNSIWRSWSFLYQALSFAYEDRKMSQWARPSEIPQGASCWGSSQNEHSAPIKQRRWALASSGSGVMRRERVGTKARRRLHRGCGPGTGS